MYAGKDAAIAMKRLCRQIHCQATAAKTRNNTRSMDTHAKIKGLLGAGNQFVSSS
jgi:hypothetical protein